MRKSLFLLSVFIIAVGMIVFVNSCKDEEIPDLQLVSLVVGDIDLNAATAPTDVPVEPAITATFNVNIDETTATAANITLLQDYDEADIAVTITVSGKTITIIPDDPLGTGTLYALTFKAALMSTDAKPVMEFTRSFTTVGTFAPSGVVAYWTFEDNANDVVGSFDPASTDIIDITYADSRNTDAGKAASFNGTTSLIEVPNGDMLMSYGDFAISFWVKALTSGKSHFVLGLAAWYGFQFEMNYDAGNSVYPWVKLACRYEQGDGTNNSEDTWFPGDGKTKDNGGWQGWTYCKDLTSAGGVDALFNETWAHVVCTFEASTKIATMYINGEMMKEFDFNLWPDNDKKKTIVGVQFVGNPAGNKLALGFIQGRDGRIVADDWANYANTGNNHFKGFLDDIRFFNKAITATEVSLMYESEKP